MSSSVSVRVPATSANLGPGYDCLGVALQLYNRVTVTPLEASAASPVSPMMAECAQRFFATAGVSPHPFAVEIEGEVPRSRGLGSSVTVRLGILHALNVLARVPLSPEQIFALCAELEGHPDNAAPGAFGGFTVAGGPEIARFEVRPELKFVLLIPDFEVATPDARRVLPPQLERLSAVRSATNVARIVAAFATHRYEQLRGCFADGLHQPFREPLIPFLSSVIAAGEAAGAVGGFLSGSGSTICCVTLDHAEAVSLAMLAAARDAGQAGARTIITQADNHGLQLA